MTVPQPESPGPAQDRCALEVTGVVAGYGGGDVLRGVSIRVAHGGITCVVGPNGAGKSTLLSTISGLLRPRLGEITLHGERSEEHTSELQSRQYLVCRLLLEKKKKKQ